MLAHAHAQMWWFFPDSNILDYISLLWLMSMEAPGFKYWILSVGSLHWSSSLWLQFPALLLPSSFSSNNSSIDCEFFFTCELSIKTSSSLLCLEAVSYYSPLSISLNSRVFGGYSSCWKYLIVKYSRPLKPLHWSMQSCPTAFFAFTN